jgi:hypothetical protein
MPLPFVCKNTFWYRNYVSGIMFNVRSVLANTAIRKLEAVPVVPTAEMTSDFIRIHHIKVSALKFNSAFNSLPISHDSFQHVIFKSRFFR